MVELDEATRRALLAREGPPASARGEILAGLRTRLGGPGGPDDPDDPDDPGDADPGDFGELGGGEPSLFDGGVATGGQIAWAAKVVGATLGLASAGLLTIKLGAVVMSSPPTEPAPTRAPELAAELEQHEPALDDAWSEPSPTAATPGAEPPRREPTPTRATPSNSESTLAAELALIRAAKQLRDRDPEAALAKLDLHGRQFPGGSLAPEREAIRVELLCALGRRDAASCTKAGTDSASAGD